MANEQTELIDQLLVVSKQQAQSINALTAGFAVMGEQIEERPTRKRVRRVGFIVVAVLVLLFSVAMFFTYQSSHHAFQEIKSCTDPSGECAQKGQEGQAQAIGQIVCNQEKIVYFTDDSYTPLPHCVVFINSEIERSDRDVAPLEVPADVPQINPPTGQAEIEARGE